MTSASTLHNMVLKQNNLSSATKSFTHRGANKDLDSVPAAAKSDQLKTSRRNHHLMLSSERLKMKQVPPGGLPIVQERGLGNYGSGG